MNLADASPELHREIEKTIPVEDLVRRDGVFNTLGMFPETARPPDPGKRSANEAVGKLQTGFVLS